MENAVILLPQIVPMLHNNGRRYPLSERYGDPFAWDLPLMRDMLARFLAASGAATLPHLHEYAQLPDKVTRGPCSPPEAGTCRTHSCHYNVSTVLAQVCHGNAHLASGLALGCCAEWSCCRRFLLSIAFVAQVLASNASNLAVAKHTLNIACLACADVPAARIRGLPCTGSCQQNPTNPNGRGARTRQ